LDSRLIKSFVSGNKDAFEILYNEYYKLIFKIAYPKINDYDKTLDLCQDIFLEIYTSRLSYKGGNFKYWILRIASNVTNDFIKKEIKERQALSAYKEPSIESDISEQDVLDLALEILDSKSYEIIVMHYVEKLKFREISVIYNVSVSTITSIASRAIKKLKEETKKWVD
jgi:RNA polymerase sigma-70 factor (ECF subfamily)